MADTPSIKIVRHTIYKGGTHQWSNRYHFSGGTPADLTHWTTFVNAVVTAEKLCMCNETTYESAICYGEGSDLPLHTISLSGTGSKAGVTNVFAAPLQTAALLRWSTDQRTSKNHPIYLFTYIHNVLVDSSVSNERIWSTQKTAFDTYASAWVSGFSDGTNTLKRAGPRGAVALGEFVASDVTHRDFIS